MKKTKRKKPLKASLVNLKAVVERLGGSWEPDGCGGYEAIAPDLRATKSTKKRETKCTAMTTWRNL